MIYLLFISGGLFLGWLLGANDAGNLFGTAVGTKMVKFSVAALIAGIFVILGAVVQGEGGSETLSRLGTVDAMGGAFTIALCAGLTVFFMNYYNLQASATHAIVGSIVGWCLFTKSGLDYSTLQFVAISWISAPFLSAIVAPLLYLLLRYLLQGSKIHIIKLDSLIRVALVVAGAFSAYSLGANNLANVSGVFLHSLPAISLDLGVTVLNGKMLLFLAGGLSIAAGIFMNGRKMIGIAGKRIMELTPEAAIVVVLTHALVLFTFSSVSLSRFLHALGLPFIPQVPVSSAQVVLGALFGISLLKGVSDAKINLIRVLLSGWILTPLIAMLTAFFSLFIVQNVFRIVVSGSEHLAETGTQSIAGGSTEVINVPVSGNITLFIAAITIIIGFALVVFFQLRKHRLIFHMQIEKGRIESQYNEMHKALTDIEIKTVQLENSALASRLQEKRNEVVNFALSISEQRKFFELLAKKIELAFHEEETDKRNEVLKEVLATLHQKMSFSHEMDNLYLKAEKVHNDFPAKINEKFPSLTEQEKRLTILLRVGFSTKEISSIMNISPKSVEISRYRLRKKLNIDNKVNLTSFIKSI